MSQINVNLPPDGPEPVRTEASHDRTAAAGINLITVLIVLVVLAALVWYLLTGPLHGLISGAGPATTTNVTVNTPTQTAPNVNVNVNATAPANTKPPAGSATTTP